MSDFFPNSLQKELKKYRTRQGRKKSTFFVVEGERCCQEALKSCHKVKSALTVQRHDFLDEAPFPRL